MQSELLQLQHPEYFEKHANAASAFQLLFNQSAIKNNDSSSHSSDVAALLLTQSPMGHFDPSKAYKLATPTTTTVIRLSELSTERALADCIANFFEADTASNPSLLVLQCDPIFSPQPLIDHACHLCTQFRAATEENVSARHVLCVVHLPPAVGRSREYCLDFNVGWQYIFVDDLRPRANDSAGLRQMMQCSAYELYAANGQVQSIMQSKVASALCRCVLLQLDSADDTFLNPLAARLRVTGFLFSDEDFMNICTQQVLAMLENRQELRQSGLHEHVDLVCSGKVCGGSTLDSLVLALEMLVTCCWARLLADLDCNNNLALAETNRELWCALLCNPSIFGQRPIAMGRFGERIEVQNTGKHGPFAAKFPFSWRIIGLLESAANRIAVETMEGDAIRRLDAVCTELLGSEAYNLLATNSGLTLDYLHDFVNICAPKYAFDFSTHHAVVRAVLQATHPLSLSSPGAIHATAKAHGNETRLFLYCSLIEHSYATETSLGQRVVDCICAESEVLRKKMKSEMSTSIGSSPIDCTVRLAAVDAAVLLTVAEHFWSTLNPDSTEDNRTTWLNHITTVQPDIAALLVYCEPNSDAGSSWRGLQCVTMLFAEVNIVEAALESEQAQSISMHFVHGNRINEIRTTYGQCCPMLGCGSDRCALANLATDSHSSTTKPKLGALGATGGTLLRCIECGHVYCCGPRDKTMLDPDSSRLSPQLYRALKAGIKVRMTHELSSLHHYDLEDGEIIEVIGSRCTSVEASQRNISKSDAQHTRLRFRGGWVSLQSTKGTRLFEPIELQPGNDLSALDLPAFIAAARSAGMAAPSTLPVFQLLCTALANCMPAITLGFLRRYASEQIFGGPLGLQDPHLLAELVAIVAGGSWTLPMQASLSFRRSLLRGLSKASGPQLLSAVAAASDEGAQLLLQKIEDDLEFKAIMSTAETRRPNSSLPSETMNKSGGVVSKLKKLLVAHPIEGSKLFAGLSTDVHGYASRLDVQRSLSALGWAPSEAELDEIISAADPAQDGRAYAAHLQELADTLMELSSLRKEISTASWTNESNFTATLADIQLVTAQAGGWVHPGAVLHNSCAVLEALARCRNAIRAYSAEMIELLNEDPGGAIGHWERQTPALHALLTQPTESPIQATEAQVFALKCVAAAGGHDALAATIQLPVEIVPWLPVDRNTPIARTVIVDPFPILSPDYLPLVQAARRCALGHEAGAHPLQHMLKQSLYTANRRLTKRMLLAVLFRISVVEKESCTAGGIKKLRELVLQMYGSMSHTVEDGLEIGIVQWFVAGCPYPDSARCGKRNLPQLQAAVWLTIAVLDQPASWHYALLCRPQIVQGSLFPSMPESEMTSIIRAAGTQPYLPIVLRVFMVTLMVTSVWFIQA
eukprot:SAG31_NODE_468_length_15250_cov_5.304138_11_plen_1378_part_01